MATPRKEFPQKGGRPTDFTPELGEEILAKMSEGLSLVAAAAECNVHRQRVYEWVGRHPEFADTIKLAQSKRQSFLERRLLNEDLLGPQITSTIFALKNANPDDWRDKREVEHSGEMTVTTKEQRDAAVAAAMMADK